jgi:hypothetical protein
MSIFIAQPSMIINACDAPWKPRMWNSWTVDDTADPRAIMENVKTVAGTAPGGKLLNLIINCHGYYNGEGRDATGGYGLSLGTGIYLRNVNVFDVLRSGGPCVREILITACGTARISPLDAQGDGDGHRFCQEIARHSGAHVTAATTQQSATNFAQWTLPQGHIDDWDGLVVKYSPDGTLVWTNDYGRGFLAWAQAGSN